MTTENVADGVVPVSGTERGHDTRPGEVEAVEAAYGREMFVSRDSKKATVAAIAALDAFRAGVPDVSR